MNRTRQYRSSGKNLGHLIFFNGGVPLGSQLVHPTVERAKCFVVRSRNKYRSDALYFLQEQFSQDS
jgi:hypothetical protein